MQMDEELGKGVFDKCKEENHRAIEKIMSGMASNEEQ
jgi:hypothetical protein